ncbi:alpha/beta hydrolase [Afifella pfennigii]|uniref:alpha/beta hydrolase n=1 Tax=Afifella pfennigii TaxID=209897 RepID=UPI00055431B9|nr:alpha/beta-hydrolase family protein [Afifella pfennigii]
MRRNTRLLGFAVLPLLLGLVFFAASLTPTLIPRNWLVQGALAGLVTAIGYMIGQAALTVWRALELPRLSGRPALVAHALVAAPVLALWVYALANAAYWQDTIRTRVGMEPAEGYHTLAVVGLAAVVFVICFAIGIAVQWLFDMLRRQLYRLMPQRTANVLGLILAVIIVVVLVRDWVVRSGFEFLDESYETAQELFVKAPPAPTDPRIPGGPGSLVDWSAMGQPGRDFVLGGPDAQAITELTGRPAKDPIRVYVGRAQSEEPAERAEIALEELKRLGAFERKVLIVQSPTGTGWLDPGGNDPIAYMHDGDIATVAVQYSYLQSPLALIFETQSGLEQASATMQTVYRYWKSLPADARPQFYVHGISLGAWSSMYAFDIFQIVNDPIQGALWTGPPFPSELWNRATAARNAESPFVLPVVGEGSLVRFTSQYGGLERARADWGRLRIVFLQHASDPIVFYKPASLWRAPQWMREPPAPDVSPAIRFVPVVTQFQLALDMAFSLATPPGYGHNYAADDYIDAWVAMTEPEDWSEADTARLKEWCGPQWGLGCRN